MNISPYHRYVEHLRHGELAYQFSAAANVPVFYPRAVSPHDVTEVLEWRVSKGLGTVYSSTCVHERDGNLYSVALIDCDEGFRLMSRVEGLPAEKVRIGMRVRLEIRGGVIEGEDPFPVFVPLESAA